MPITQKHVAEHLGLSLSTVARALNGYPNVSEQKRREIRAAAERLGYTAHSNAAARALAGRRHGKPVRRGVIGGVFPDLETRAMPYFLRILEGVRQGARQHDLHLMLLDAVTPACLDQIDGLVCYSGTRTMQQSLRAEMPLVSVMTGDAGLSLVTGDDAGGIRQAMKYLLHLGHRRIAYLIDTSAFNEPQNPIALRYAAYRESLREAGIAPDPRWVGELACHVGAFSGRGRLSMGAWLERDWRELGCTALLVQNDSAASGAMIALRQAGFRVPEDVSVIGFDGTEECEIVTPRLTSVEVPLQEIGVAAVELLLRELNAENAPCPPERIVFPTRLHRRDSTAPPCLRT